MAEPGKGRLGAQVAQSRECGDPVGSQTAAQDRVGIQDIERVNKSEPKNEDDDLPSDCDDLDVGDEAGQPSGINQLYSMKMISEDSTQAWSHESHLDRRKQRSKSFVNIASLFETPRTNTNGLDIPTVLPESAGVTAPQNRQSTLFGKNVVDRR